MIKQIKKALYFKIALYFTFFAKIQLNIWKPKIIVITGSTGKTTLLHLVEAQKIKNAKYSHKANSSYGIPFDILNLKRKTLKKTEWLVLFLLAPIKAFSVKHSEIFYFVEADSDRPGEGKFLAKFLKPNVTIWLSLSRTHTSNFDPLVENGQFKTVEEAIAFDFGYFLEQTQDVAIIDGDNNEIMRQSSRTKAKLEIIKKNNYELGYKLFKDHTEFKINKQTYKTSFLLPEGLITGIIATQKLFQNLEISKKISLEQFKLPPGRSSLFQGIKNTTIIDSSYNSSLEAVQSMLHLFEDYPAQKKWLVLGDILELGKEEKEEHIKLATLVKTMKLEKIILMGPRVSKYTYPELEKSIKPKMIEKFENPKEVLDYLQSAIKGEETIMFKGARFLEGIIEHLLANKSDIEKLARREEIWKLRRAKWNL